MQYVITSSGWCERSFGTCISLCPQHTTIGISGVAYKWSRNNVIAIAWSHDRLYGTCVTLKTCIFSATHGELAYSFPCRAVWGDLTENRIFSVHAGTWLLKLSSFYILYRAWLLKLAPFCTHVTKHTAKLAPFFPRQHMPIYGVIRYRLAHSLVHCFGSLRAINAIAFKNKRMLSGVTRGDPGFS